jgi:hypothetical protein
MDMDMDMDMDMGMDMDMDMDMELWNLSDKCIYEMNTCRVLNSYRKSCK